MIMKHIKIWFAGLMLMVSLVAVAASTPMPMLTSTANKMIAELELNKKRMRFLAIEGLPEQGARGLKQIIQNCDTILKLSYAGFQEKDFPFVRKT